MGKVAINGDAGNGFHTLIKCPHQVKLFLPDGVDSRFQQKAYPRVQPRETVGVQRTRFQRRGHLNGVGLAVGLNTAAAGEQGTNCDTLPDIQTACTLGAKQALMAGKTENVDVHFPYVNWNYPRRLGSVHHQQQTVGLGDCSDFPHIHQIPRQIGAVGADNGPGVAPDGSFKGFIRDPPPLVGGQNGQFHASFLQFIQGPQDRIVLHGGGNHMVAGA